MSELSDKIGAAKEFVEAELGFELKKSMLAIYSPEKWVEFCQQYDFDSEKTGLYVPSAHLACIRRDNPFLLSTIYHEYLGHGTFCEHSRKGQEIIIIEQNGQDGNAYLQEKTEPIGLLDLNFQIYEAYAVWIERLICISLGDEDLWEQKKECAPPNYIFWLEQFLHAEKEMGREELFSKIGF